MTLNQFRKLRRRDFENGAVLDEIEKTFEQRDKLLAACVLARDTFGSTHLRRLNRATTLWKLDAVIAECEKETL